MQIVARQVALIDGYRCRCFRVRMGLPGAMINLNDLQYFVHVVDMRGFAPAEREVNIPKSTLSKRVSELEKHLGVSLINRSTRQFSVTEVGEVFYRHAIATLAQAKAAEDAVRQRLAEPVGAVRITASVATTRHMLADMLPELAIAFPKIRITLHATDQFMDLAHDGFDLAVRNHFGPLPDSDMVQIKVKEDPIFLVASPAYLHNRGEPAEPEDLPAHDALLVGPLWITWTNDNGWPLRHDSGKRVSIVPTARFFSNESKTLRNAAMAGLGIACLPCSFCYPGLTDGRLRRVLPQWTAGCMSTTLLTPYRRGQLPSVRTVIDYLTEKIALWRPDARCID